MRKKERRGPGIATVTDWGGPTLASADGEGSDGVEPRTIGARDKAIGRTAARRAMILKKGFANGLGDNVVKRSVQAFKMASPVRFMVKTT
jgi:hypothetical protein